MASLTRWTWVSVNSGSWWWTGRPGVLRFMGLQRVGHDWATELNWTELMLLMWTREWQPIPVLLPGKSHGRRSLVGCSPWDCKESDTTERLCFPFSLSCIGEGNGNPFQCSCLENPRDGGAWWAAVYGVSQSRTQPKGLSSSSSSSSMLLMIYNYTLTSLPRWRSGKESTCQWWNGKRCRLDHWFGKIP